LVIVEFNRGGKDMRELIAKHVAIVALVVPVIAAMVAANQFATAQDKEPAKKAAKGRLPAHYADVVDDAQREEIYKVQAKHQPKIADLRKQLKEAVAKRDAEVRAVLTAEQQKKIDQLTDAAAESDSTPPAKKPAKRSAAKSAETKAKKSS
jgi:hypothetical protein